MIFLLTIVFMFVLFLGIRLHRKAKLEAAKMARPSYRRMVRQQQQQQKSRQWNPLTSLAKDIGLSEQTRFLPLVGGLLGSSLTETLYHTWFIGALAGFLAPYFVLRLVSHILNREYHSEVKDALRFISSSFSAGAQVEDWISELHGRTTGRLKKEVQMSYALMKNGASAQDILSRWSQLTTEPHFAYALLRMSKVLYQSGDMVSIVDDALQEMLRDDDFERRLKGISKGTRNMIIAMASLPGFTYFLFHHVIATLLQAYPWLWIVLVLGLAAMGGVLVWFRRVSTM